MDINTACSGFCYAPGDRRPRDPRRRRPQRAGDRRGEALRHHRLDRPAHLHPVRRRRRRGGGQRGRRAGASGRWCGARRRSAATCSSSRAGARTSTRTARRCSGGRPRRSPSTPGWPASGPAWRREDIAAFVAHQANTRIIDGIVKRLDLPNAVIAKDIVESGNTSAASIPLALSKLVETPGGARPAPRCCCSGSAVGSPTPARSSAVRNQQRQPTKGTTAWSAPRSSRPRRDPRRGRRREPGRRRRGASRSPRTSTSTRCRWWRSWWRPRRSSTSRSRTTRSRT